MRYTRTLSTAWVILLETADRGMCGTNAHTPQLRRDAWTRLAPEEWDFTERVPYSGHATVQDLGRLIEELGINDKHRT
jgi:hypothetical protein